MSSEKEFIISDLHLGHANVIIYCNRPFTNVGHMNAMLVRKWNKTVSDTDTVYFLGDLAMGNPYKWLKELNGNIVLIRGNHDKKLQEAKDSKIITYDGEELYLIHNPDNRDKDWDGWTIHGHIHNNDLVEYPLFNPDKKMFNVSCELLNYRPVEIRKLLKYRDEHV